MRHTEKTPADPNTAEALSAAAEQMDSKEIRTMTSQRRVTKEQIGQVVALLVAGKIPFDDAQAFIEKYRDQLSDKMRRRQEQERLEAERSAFWEKIYPGKKETLEEVLRPFHGRPELKQALPDLEERVRKAFFWLEDIPNDVITYRASQADDMHELTSLIHASFWCEHVGSLWDRLGGNLGDVLGLGYKDILWHVAQHVSLPQFRSAVDDFFASGDFAPWDSLGSALGEAYAPRTFFWVAFWTPLIESCAYILLDRPEEAAKLKPLRDLWLAGNFPVGLSLYGQRLVLVA